MTTALPDIEFDGKKIKANKAGYYKCPFLCGDSRYPAPKWKTEAGIRKHLETCSQSPQAKAQRDAKDAERRETEAAKLADAIAKSSVKIGDTVFVVSEVIVHPTHDHRGRRVRYEPVKQFRAEQVLLESAKLG